MFLESIDCPADVKKLNVDQLNMLCGEIRQELVETVSKNGGHLASNLGVVELTVGIHYVFDCPSDSVLFDVGHQSYVHKLLTGRRGRFDTIRKEDGLSGFMYPPESDCDAFISGHSSNSVSAALGIARANTLADNGRYVVSVVGDGALTGGMVFEGLNNSGRSKDKIIVVLNDNQMSISRNVGSLARHLTGIRVGKRYINTKRKIRRFLDKIPVVGRPIGKILFKLKSMLKAALYYNNYFESLGYYYIGPIDGNNISDVVNALRSAKDTDKPVIVHACTKKGYGYTPAEENPVSYHGVSNFDVNSGIHSQHCCFSSVFGDTMCELAKDDDKLCAITAAMTDGTRLEGFREKYPRRFFDVGIAEQHAVTFSAGLSSKGLKPVFAVYSSFLQRGYDQLLHDVAICGYNVTIAVDRAGIVGEDGITHQGIFDVAFINTIPGFTVYSPSFYDELKLYLKKSVDTSGPAVIRYPRGGEGYKPEWYECADRDYIIYGGIDNKTIAVTYGRLFSNVCAAAEKTGAAVCKINRIIPVPGGLIEELENYKRIVFYEEGIKNGGIGQTVGEMLVESGYSGEFILKAIDDYIPHRSVDSAFEKLGFDTRSITSVLNGDKE